jgi:hypothetical protein
MAMETESPRNEQVTHGVPGLSHGLEGLDYGLCENKHRMR